MGSLNPIQDRLDILFLGIPVSNNCIPMRVKGPSTLIVVLFSCQELSQLLGICLAMNCFHVWKMINTKTLPD